MSGLFEKAKDKRLASKISIRSPTAFRESIRKLERGGLSLKEEKALVLARTRGTLQLRRSNLSGKERKQFREISKIRVPRHD